MYICIYVYMYMVVGVGYHHPPIQWPHTPLDARQRGNLAAVACQGGIVAALDSKRQN